MSANRSFSAQCSFTSSLQKSHRLVLGTTSDGELSLALSGKALDLSVSKVDAKAWGVGVVETCRAAWTAGSLRYSVRHVCCNYISWASNEIEQSRNILTIQQRKYAEISKCKTYRRDTAGHKDRKQNRFLRTTLWPSYLASQPFAGDQRVVRLRSRIKTYVRQLKNYAILFEFNR